LGKKKKAMKTKNNKVDGEELADAIHTLALHTGNTPFRLLLLMIQDGYLDTSDVAEMAPHLGLPYGQIKHIVEDII
tara:strand:- start:383 stop:610 length:228 start_codon:yes stop_codon:yes gene_type:complete